MKNLFDVFLKGSALRTFFLLFMVALIPRLFCVMQVQHGFLFDFIPLDSDFYDQWAMDIVRKGFWKSDQLYPGAPFYAHVLASVYFIFGHSFFAVRILQALLGAITMALLYFVAQKISNSVRFAIAVFTTALFFRLGVFYELWILSESWAVFFLVAFMLVFLWAMEKPSLSRFALAGCLAGLLTATKPNFFVLVFAASAGMAWMNAAKFNGRNVLSLLVFVASALVVLSPIAIKNYQISGEFIPFRSDAGFVFYEGNGPHANGRSSKIPFLPGDKLQMLAHAKKIAEQERGENLTEKQAADFWSEKARTHIVHSPAAFLKANLIKLRLLVSGFEMPDIYSSSLLISFIPALHFLPLGFFFLIPLAVAGMMLTFFRNRLWTGVGIAALVSAASLFYSYITERYKIPLYPLFLLFSVAAIFGWADRSVSKKRKIAALVAFFCVLALSFDKPFVKENQGNHSAGYNFLGAQAMKHENYEEAIQFFKQALEIAPAMYHSMLHTSMGIALQKWGKREEAVLEYQKALVLNPADRRARESLLRLYAHAEP